MEHLYDKLFRYAEEDFYPYHMPGHKRRPWGMLPEAMCRADITEIDGFDDLHQPEGILLELQREAAGLYGAEESHYLVGGSTCGILSAVSCAVPFGGRLLMARNCHRSAYHAAYLRHLQVSYLYPPYLEPYGIFDAVTPEQVRQALDEEPGIQAVLLVSPTYEGRISGIASIAHIVHERGITLIVDEAHGAHLGLAEGMPLNSCQAGADLVVHSVHKTLPALTQTALLHVNGRLIDRGLLGRFLRIYQTSSPSYLLMASIDNALQYVKLQGRDAFRRFRELYGKMTEELAACRCLKILAGDAGKQDIGKLVISTGQTGLSGKQLYDILLQKYHLQLEMASGDFALAMFTVNDGEEAYRRMSRALLEIDGILTANGAGIGKASTERGSGTAFFTGRAAEDAGGISIAEAWDREAEDVPLAESVGRIAAEFVNLYPPGIPILAPGERMTPGICRKIRNDLEAGLKVQGVRMGEGERMPQERCYMRVLREDSAAAARKGH